MAADARLGAGRIVGPDSRVGLPCGRIEPQTLLGGRDGDEDSRAAIAIGDFRDRGVPGRERFVVVAEIGQRVAQQIVEISSHGRARVTLQGLTGHRSGSRRLAIHHQHAHAQQIGVVRNDLVTP